MDYTIQSYLKQQERGLNSLFSIKEEEVQALLSLVEKRKGKLVLTGIGKSGFVAEHVASTYNSISLYSLFVNPVNCIHGDLGIINNEDIVICLSKSGNTDELVRFVDCCQGRNSSTLVCVHSNLGENALKQRCDLSVFIPTEHELDKNDTIPTISSVCYLIFLQSLGMSVAEKTGLHLKSFLDNHPGGAIGLIDHD